MGDHIATDLVVAAEPDTTFDGESGLAHAVLIMLEPLFVLHVGAGSLADAGCAEGEDVAVLCVGAIKWAQTLLFDRRMIQRQVCSVYLTSLV